LCAGVSGASWSSESKGVLSRLKRTSETETPARIVASPPALLIGQAVPVRPCLEAAGGDHGERPRARTVDRQADAGHDLDAEPDRAVGVERA